MIPTISPWKAIISSIRIILYISIGLLIMSFVKKNILPPKQEILPQLYQEPIQKAVQKPTFNVEVGGLTYTIDPLYKYELYGLVVSQHDSAAWWDYYHKKWGDSLNLKDICVIWGDNLDTEVYRRMRFRNGSWTCYISVNAKTAEEDWSQFNMAALSNNHLLSDNSQINNILRSLQVGDQIYLKGYLASYWRLGSSFRRGTSISRTDKGNSACETIYLTDFKILKPANIQWRSLHRWSKYLVAGFLLLLILAHLKAPLGW